jgi:hypothetical protein
VDKKLRVNSVILEFDSNSPERKEASDNPNQFIPRKFSANVHYDIHRKLTQPKPREIEKFWERILQTQLLKSYKLAAEIDNSKKVEGKPRKLIPRGGRLVDISTSKIPRSKILETLKRIRMVYGFQIVKHPSERNFEMAKGNTKHIITLTVDNHLQSTVIADTSKKSIKNNELDITEDSWYNFLYCFNWFDSNSRQFVPTFRNFSISDQKW